MSRTSLASSRLRRNHLQRLALEHLEARTMLSGIQIDRFALPQGTVLLYTAPGPDGNVWFLDSQDTGTPNIPKVAYQIGEVGSDGTVTVLPLPTGLLPEAGGNQDLVTGSDGKLYFSVTTTIQDPSKLEWFDPSLQTFGTVDAKDFHPGLLTSDPAGLLYYSSADTKGNAIVGQIDPRTGTISSHAISPTVGDAIDRIGGLTYVPGSGLWFTAVDEGAQQQGVVGVWDPTQTGDAAVQTFVVTNNVDNVQYTPSSIVLGPDGNLDFIESNYGGTPFTFRLGSIDQKGDLPATTVDLPTQGAVPQGLAVGADGALWTTNGNALSGTSDPVSFYRVTTASDITPVVVSQRFDPFYRNLITGPDGNLWFYTNSFGLPQSMSNNAIVRMIVPPNRYVDYSAVTGEGPEGQGFAALPGSPATAVVVDQHLTVPGGQIFTQKEPDLDPTKDAVIEGTFHVKVDALHNPLLGPNDALVLGIADGTHLFQLRAVPGGNNSVVVSLVAADGSTAVSTTLSDPSADHAFRVVKHANGKAELFFRNDATGKFSSVGTLADTSLPVDPKTFGAPGFEFGVSQGAGSPGAVSGWSDVRYAVGSTDPVPPPILAAAGKVTLSKGAKSSAGPLSVGPGDDLVVDLKLTNNQPFHSPTSVLLTYADGSTFDMVVDDLSSNQPSLSREFIFHRKIGFFAQGAPGIGFHGDVGGPVTVTVAADDLLGSPIQFTHPGFVVQDTAQTQAISPTVTISSPNLLQHGGPDGEPEDFLDVHTNAKTVVTILASPANSTSRVKLVPIDNSVPGAMFTDTNGNRVSSVESDPGQGAILIETFTALAADAGTATTKFVAIDESSGVASERLLFVTNADIPSSDASLVLQTYVDPEIVPRTEPGGFAKVVQVSVTSNHPISTPFVAFTSEDGQFNGSAENVRADDASGTRWTADISTPSYGVGLYYVTAYAGDLTKASSPIGTSTQGIFYEGTAGELIRNYGHQPVPGQIDPAGGRQTSPRPGDKVIGFDANDPSKLAVGEIGPNGELVSRGGGTIVGAGAGGGLVSRGGGSFVYADPASLVAPGAGGGIVGAGAGGGLVSRGGGSIFVDDAALGLLLGGAANNLIYPSGAAVGIVGAGAGGGLTFNGQLAALLSRAGANIVSRGGASLVSRGGGSIFTPTMLNNNFSQGSDLQRMAEGLASGNGSSLRSAPGRTSAPPAAPPGVAATPGAAAVDALLDAQFLSWHGQILADNAAPAAQVAARAPYIAAAIDAAATVADSGFAALTAAQISVLQRQTKVINLIVAPATPGAAIAPGSLVVLTPANSADLLSLGSASADPSSELPITLGGTVVSFGGQLPEANQPGSPTLAIQLYGAPMPLVSAAPGRIEATIPALATIGDSQLIVLTTSDGRIAFGHIVVQAPTGTVQFSAPTFAWGAKGLTAEVTVTRSGGSSGSLAATVDTADGSAKAGVDYSATSAPVFFGDGDTAPQVVVIPLINGPASAVKTVSLVLNAPFNAANLGTQATATLNLDPTLGTIAGTVFVDTNSDGAHQPSEAGRAGVTVYLDANGNLALDPTEVSTTTFADGSYAFGALAAGTYKVRIVAPTSATQTGPTQHSATTDNTGTLVSGQDFGLVVAMPVALSGVPANAVIEATGPNGAVVSFATPTASDGLNANLPVTSDHPSGGIFPIGTTTVTFSSTDGQTSASASFNVTVRDTTAPTLSGVSTDQTVMATTAAGAVVAFASPTATDLVDAHPTIVVAPASGSVFPVGTTTVVVTATDHAGNIRTASFRVIVTAQAVIPLPAFSSLPASQSVAATSPAGVVVTFASPTVVDPGDPNPTIVCSPPSGTDFPVGTTIVTCTSTDHLGRTITATFAITVAPFIPIVPPPDGPKVTSAQEQAKFSKYVLAFDGALDASRAGNKANYAVSYTMKVGKKTKIVKSVVKSATYNPIAHIVTLTLKKKPTGATSAQVAITGTGPAGIAGSNGLLLDGDRNGTPGGNLTVTLTGSATVTTFGLAHPRGLRDLGGPVLGTRRARP